MLTMRANSSREFPNEVFDEGVKITNGLLRRKRVWPKTVQSVKEIVEFSKQDSEDILERCCGLRDSPFPPTTYPLLDFASRELNGWHPIHLACLIGKSDVVKYFVERDKSAAIALYHTDRHTISPLMCAAIAGFNEILEYLFAHGATLSGRPSVDIEWTIKGKSAACFTTVARHIGSHSVGSPIDILELFSRGILEDDVDIFREILYVTSSSIMRMDRKSSHPLTAVQRLQLSQLLALDFKEIFFYALAKGYCKIVREMLKAKTSPVRIMSEGYPPLHYTIVNQFKDESAVLMVSLLLNNGAPVNQVDSGMKTALYYAAKAGYRLCSFLLIQHDAQISLTDMRNLNERIPNFLKTHFNSKISSTGMTSSATGELVSIDLRFMGTWNSEKDESRELNFLQYVVAEEQVDLLMHPVIQTYLHVKWIFFRKFFTVSLCLYLLQLIFYSIYIHKMYASEEEDGNENNTMSNGIITDNTMTYPSRRIWNDLHPATGALTTFGVLGTCSMAVTRVFYLMVSGVIYIRTRTFRGQLLRYGLEVLTIAMTAISLLPSFTFGDRPPTEWMRSTAAISILVVWCNTLWYFTRHPELGIYIEMLRKVLQNFATFFATYVCLLVGFALSFSVIQKGKSPFQNVFTSMREIFKMMVGEVDADKVDHSSAITYVLYMAFMFIVTVALVNLLVGLAVHDIQGLLVRSKINKSVRQIQYMNLIESVIYSKLLSNSILLPRIVKRYLRRTIKIKLDSHQHIVYVFPNKFDDKRLPFELKQSALDIARQNAEVEKTEKREDTGVKVLKSTSHFP